MESQPQNPEFRINPENFHPCAKAAFFHNLTNKISICPTWSGFNGILSPKKFVFFLMFSSFVPSLHGPVPQLFEDMGHMGLDATRSVFGFFEKARLKPA